MTVLHSKQTASEMFEDKNHGVYIFLIMKKSDVNMNNKFCPTKG